MKRNKQIPKRPKPNITITTKGAGPTPSTRNDWLGLSLIIIIVFSAAFGMTGMVISIARYDTNAGIALALLFVAITATGVYSILNE